MILLVVAGGVAIYQWGGDVLLKQAVPHGHFQAPPQGGAPVYSSADMWLARPGMAQDPSRWNPDGAGAENSGAAAVFYIHPTTYLERDKWNAPFEPGGDSEFRTRLFVQSQASAFTRAGQVWAPRYRQAAFGAFLLDSADAQQSLNLAYQDVEFAFAEFLKSVPDGPIILAGHSQGALHLERLLARKVAGTPVAKRIVAAYVVGWPISVTSDLPRLGLPACTAADQVGCILSWMSFGEPANPQLILDQWEDSKGLNGGPRRQEDMLCVNPITGTRNGVAPPQDNPGSLVPAASLQSATLQPGLVGARCEKGLLLIGGSIPALGPYVLPGNNYHVYDYALFWSAIRGDAWRRTEAWRQ
ncbi:MAG TPA: DUF3089 domain-containing protein [Sphingomicrobium sp.]|nr:DUF3089 domain-containing protein [Sphingomicrobium sp.]